MLPPQLRVGLALHLPRAPLGVLGPPLHWPVPSHHLPGLQPHPFSTPKPGLAGRVSAGSAAPGRPSIGTPRARIPSAIAMPPPASPVARSVSQNAESAAWASPRPESAASSRSMLNDERDQLQSRIQALEYENQRLRAASAPPDVHQDSLAQLEALRLEHEDAQSRASELEAQLKAAEQSLAERATQIQELESARSQVLSSLDEEKAQGESRIQTLEQELEETQLLAQTLKETIASKETAEREGGEKLKAKQAEIVTLEIRLKRTQTELDEERIELGGQVDELRQAGQETIALYEERLSAVDREKEELEARITTLEARARAATRSPSPTAAPKVASSATEIDNETLRDQVVHLQKKVAKLEDALEDAHAASERDEAALGERVRRLKEKEEAAKKELSEGRKEVERMIKSEASARRRVEEVEEALQESTVALEDARAEVEGLRAELTNLDGLVTGNGDGDLYSRVAQVAKRASTDKSRFTDEIAKLQDLVEEARRREMEAMEEVEKLRQALAAQSTEVDTLKKKANRDLALNNGIQSPQSSSVSKHDLSAAREEITGLKHIVQELQKESLAATQRTKLLESENQLLLSEAEQLRQEVQILEENLDNSLTREENALDEAPSGDAASLQRLMKDQKVKFEMELEQLRKRLADSEMKSARVAHDLNKEISELEALIESKIYREDELEQELERTKEKLARQRKISKGSSEVVDTRRRAGSVAGSDVSDADGVCEICEKPGHDIFTCSLLSAGTPTDDRTSDSELFCEDCESHGHVAADCPHSLDVF
ncbi:CAP-Gly domain-containing linker protein 2 [Mycena venus]|uniref:CAP-Gly domain-containing linker protein 2 n=1 Tax=Mycena venus TaxID=2733690 RepID=A0A8H6YN12_9AGAR|nr:CAP-Gly domain-containing linker protein 2 [Mycena venus]